MKFCVLSSGSKGNCTYLETRNHKILIDMGTTNKYIENSLIELGINPNSIDIIFITHDHKDHISALKVFSKKHKVKVYTTAKLIDVLSSEIDKEIFVEIVNKTFMDDLYIDIIKTSHDATDSIGFIFEDELSSLVYITDTGYLNKKYFSLLNNKTSYIFESNHDIEMLMNGHYRHELKLRILSDKGHMSNEMSSDYLVNLIGDNTKNIVLAHLSEDNNTEDLAYNTLFDKLNGLNINNKNIIIAKQNVKTDFIEC